MFSFNLCSFQPPHERFPKRLLCNAVAAPDCECLYDGAQCCEERRVLLLQNRDGTLKLTNGVLDRESPWMVALKCYE